MKNTIFENILYGMNVLQHYEPDITADHDILCVTVKNDITTTDARVLEETGWFRESEDDSYLWCHFV